MTNNLFLNSFLLLVLIINLSHQEKNIFNMTQTFLPYSLTLLNNDNILVINNGIHFFDANLQNEKTEKKVLFDTEIAESDFNKIAIAQFSTVYDEYIMVLAKNIMYFFTKEYNCLIKNFW